MITFFCPCGHNFFLDSEAASAVVRCPKCNALIESVPVDAKKDGQADLEETYELVGEPAEDEPRPRPVPVLQLTDPLPDDAPPLPVLAYQAKSETRSPVVGAIIRLKQDMTQVMDWAIVDDPPPQNLADILYALTKVRNILPMVCVLFTHLGAAALLWLTFEKMYFFAPIAFVLFVPILSHLVNVLDEIAVEERDELPRFSRDFRFREDYLNPFVILMTALLLCFAPAFVMLYANLPISGIITAGMMLCLICAYPFPAILLTLSSSGAIANMRPDRVRDVVQIAGKKYLISVLLFIGGAATYGLGLTGFFFETLYMADIHTDVPHWIIAPYIALPLMCVGVFILHAFAWHLGLIYRSYSNQFPWVGRGKMTQRPPIVVKRAKPKYVVPAEPIEM